MSRKDATHFVAANVSSATYKAMFAIQAKMQVITLKQVSFTKIIEAAIQELAKTYGVSEDTKP